MGRDAREEWVGAAGAAVEGGRGGSRERAEGENYQTRPTDESPGCIQNESDTVVVILDLKLQSTLQLLLQVHG